MEPPLNQSIVTSDGLQLRIKRMPDSVELEIQNADIGSVMSQRMAGSSWIGELRTTRPRGLKSGAQSLSLPEAGLEKVTFDGSGKDFKLTVSPTRNSTLGSPVVSSDGKTMTVRFPAPPLPSLQIATPNLSRPVPVPTQSFLPPLRTRAIAPPVGDMAVGTMTLRNRGYINISGPPVTLTARGANPRDLLMVMAQMGGYGFAYSEQPPQISKQGKEREPVPIESREQVYKITPITVAFRRESFERAFNFVLATAGLQARREGNTVMVGPAVLQQTFGPQVSKVYRLNQASPDSAADYLANLGALVTKTFSETITATTGVPLTGASTTNPQTTRTSTEVKVQQYGGESGPLIGLRATTDSRLGTITLVGESPLVVVAEQYLRQLDLRQRQVALSVKILDVTLNNDSDIDNSFALRFGNNFIVNDGGQLLAAFGRNLPATQAEFSAANVNERFSENSSQSFSSNNQLGSNSSQSLNTQFSDGLNVDLANGQTLTRQQLDTVNRQLVEQTGTQIQEFTRQVFIPNPNADPADPATQFIERPVIEYRVVPTAVNNGSAFPTQSAQGLTTSSLSRIESIISNAANTRVSLSRLQTGANALSNTGQSGSIRTSDSSSSASYSGLRRRNPGLNYPDQQFFDFLRAQIISSNTKILASPTLILQEGGAPYDPFSSDTDGSDNSISRDGKIGRERTNEALVRVGTQLVTSYVVNQDANGISYCQPVFGTAGLTFGAKVDKIDDNGFVTFSISPEISAEVGGQQVGSCGAVSLINSRTLDTGQLRVRDGQTLILTGVISDSDQQTVAKWPVLGDLPLIGQFFRRSTGSRSKNELVIMITPRIIDDTEGGSYGYGYKPSTGEAKRMVYGIR